MQETIVSRTGSEIMVTLKTQGKADIAFPCRDIRGALVWPTVNSPGYFCIIAQHVHPNEQGKLPLRLLYEYEDELPNNVFKDLIDQARIYSCCTYYNDFRKENEDLRTLFYEYCKYQRVTNVEIAKAPLVGKFYIGIKLIQEWVRGMALEVPEHTVLYRQLKSMHLPHLEDANPEERFYAVNALQFLIASAEKEPWTVPTFQGAFIGESYERSREKADPEAWT